MFVCLKRCCFVIVRIEEGFFTTHSWWREENIEQSEEGIWWRLDVTMSRQNRILNCNRDPPKLTPPVPFPRQQQKQHSRCEWVVVCCLLRAYCNYIPQTFFSCCRSAPVMVVVMGWSRYDGYEKVKPSTGRLHLLLAHESYFRKAANRRKKKLRVRGTKGHN